MLACPRCQTPLGRCACRWPVTDGVPDLYLAAPEQGEAPAVTAEVRDFYEAHPFPSYQAGDDLGALARRASQNPLLRALDREIPPGARVVEVGCGTGQLSLYLASGGRTVLGLDLSLASLRVAEAFRRQHRLESARFARANLFRPPVLPGSVDLVIAQGVLHHTGAPQAAIPVLRDLLRPGGYLLVGLYNRWGRLLLPLLRRRHAAALGDARGDAWYLDQHAHPVESRHTADEVLGWLDRAGLDFVSCVPPLVPGVSTDAVFTPQPRGSRWLRWWTQLGWLGRAADGGLWITVAQRRGAA